MENIKKIISWPVILGIQVITTVVLLFFIFKLNILPTTYAVMVGMILVLLGFINYALMKPNKKEHHRKTKPREIIGKVLSLILSVLMVFGSVMNNKGYSTLDDITNSNTYRDVGVCALSSRGCVCCPIRIRCLVLYLLP